jgi:hypothetical protein
MIATAHHAFEDLLVQQRAQVAWTLGLTAVLGLVLVLAG